VTEQGIATDERRCGVCFAVGERELKTIIRVTTASLMALAGMMPAGADGTNKTPPLTLEPCFIDGVKERISCASVMLPLDYSNPGGESIPVHVAVIPAKSAAPAADPFLVFAGGPGQAAGEFGFLIEAAFDDIRSDRDILLIDQRGTGKSHGLRCSFEGLEDSAQDFRLVAEECRAEFTIDVRHFTLENIIRDTDEIRELLGYQQLNLWGGSYGTKSISLYLKRYPERVRSIIVDGILPPDQSLFLSAPASAERALGKLVEDCKTQPACNTAFPNFREQVDTLVEQAANGELRYEGIDPVSGKYIELDIGFEMAVESIRSVMYSAEGTTLLPYVVNEATGGNLTPMLASLMNSSAVSDSMYLGATMSLLCGEDVASIDAEAAAKAGEGSFARDSYYRIWSGHCSGWDYVRPAAADFFAPINSNVPALMLSGDLDPVTPPSLGDHWAKGFPNGRHITVKGTGHITSHAACMPKLLSEFIDHLDPALLDTGCLDHLNRLPIVVGVNGNVQ